MLKPGEAILHQLSTNGHVLIEPGVLPHKDIIQLCSQLMGKQPLGFKSGGQYHFDSRGVNLVGGGQSNYVSDTNCAIPWHCEEYCENEPLEWLFLYCVKAATNGGATGFVDFRAVLKSLAFGGAEEICYNKLSVGFTEWQLLQDRKRISFAAPRCDRQVKLRNSDVGLEKIIEQCDLRATFIKLRPGQLLGLNNAQMLHSRTAHSGERCILRMAF